MDMFIEKIVKRRKSLLDLLKIAGIIALTVLICYLLLVYYTELSMLLILGLIYLAYFLLTNCNIEYEYAVTNGNLDIDEIINKRKRKSLFSADCRNFETVARIGSDKYTDEIKNCRHIRDYTSHNYDAEVWFIYMRLNNAPAVVLFEPSPQMIDSFFTFNPRKVFRN